MRPARPVFAAVLAVPLLFALTARSARGQEHWVEVRSPHFHVVTNGLPSDGQKLVNEFEDMRYVIHYRFPQLQLDSSAPLLIAAPRDLSSAEQLEPSRKWMNGLVSGNFIAGRDRNYATVRLDSRERGAQALVFQDYVESVLSLNAPHIPAWFRHGLSEFFAWTRFSDGRIYVGAPSERQIGLNDGRALPLSIVLDMDEDDAFGDHARGQQFFAESWALVHYLTFAPGMGDGQKLAEFFSKLQAGVDQKVAFRSLFGDPTALDPKLRTYMSKFLSTAGIIPAAPPIDPKLIVQRDLSPAEAAFWQGTVHLGSGDDAGGRSLVSHALALDPGLSAAHEQMGYLLYDDGKNDQAREQWKEALTLDPTRYRARFAYLMIGVPFAQQTAEQSQQTLTELRAILHLDMRFAPAYAEVALLHWQRGDLPNAQRAAEEAARVEPWRPGYRLLVARLMLAQGNAPAAAQILRSTAQMADMSNRAEAVALWASVPVKDRGEGPDLHSDLLPGTLLAHGTLGAVQCEIRPKATGMSADLQLANAPAGASLHVAGNQVLLGANDTLYRGGPSLSPCAHATGRQALVGYRPTRTGAGDLVWLQVLDDAPTPPAVAATASATGLSPSPSTTSSFVQ